MLKLRRIGVTGGVASGKTTVCQIFEELGAYVVFADRIVHHLLIPGTDLGKEVEELLGAECIENGAFNRNRISAKVFNDPDLLTRLEKILHPKVREEIEKEYIKASNTVPMPTFFVAEVPLLFEVGFDSLFDETIAVIVPENECKRRFSMGNAYQKRVERQFPIEEKAKKAKFLIDNSGSIENLRFQVINLNKIILRSLCLT